MLMYIHIFLCKCVYLYAYMGIYMHIYLHKYQSKYIKYNLISFCNFVSIVYLIGTWPTTLMKQNLWNVFEKFLRNLGKVVGSL